MILFSIQFITWLLFLSQTSAEIFSRQIAGLIGPTVPMTAPKLALNPLEKRNETIMTFPTPIQVIEDRISKLITEQVRVQLDLVQAKTIREEIMNSTEFGNNKDSDNISACTKPIWIPASYGQIPQGALSGGHEAIDSKWVYVARAKFNQSLIPGKVVTGHLAAYVGYGPWEMSLFEYEVLITPRGMVEWIDYDGVLPNGIIEGGYDGNGSPIYIGRADFRWWRTEGDVEVGAFYPDRKEMEVTYEYRSYVVKENIQLLSINPKLKCT